MSDKWTDATFGIYGEVNGTGLTIFNAEFAIHEARRYGGANVTVLESGRRRLFQVVVDLSPTKVVVHSSLFFRNFKPVIIGRNQWKNVS